MPPEASVVVRTEPPDATNDSYLHRFAVALLPGRKIIPAAMWSIPTPPEALSGSDYEIVVGSVPPTPSGRLVLSIPEGTVWKRRP